MMVLLILTLYSPLCVEEMDISDKNFKPCPCGYQICQFCYNNIRQNPELNGRCPACRRLYDDESVEYKTISSEEYKIQQLKKEKRDREKKQREKEKKETEMANKKHLAGLRVVQKNLVYVTGLNPPCSPDDLHSVLRSDKYFGQYGKISKIVINKKTPGAPVNSCQPQQSVFHPHSNHGLVVYVTFTRKEDALRCIVELDGTMCDGRILRAAHGTTKYCSSYLRGHPCPNPNCMFLHEPGEEADSYTRKDLSTQQGIKMGMMGFSGSSLRPNQSTGEKGQPSHTREFGELAGDDDAAIQHSEDEDQHDLSKNASGPVLPATAHWAQGVLTSNAGSPSVNNNTALANSAAFPTLGEIIRELKPIVKKEVKPKVKSSKATRDAPGLSPDEVDIDDLGRESFVDKATEHLRELCSRGGKIPIKLRPSRRDRLSSSSYLFAYNPGPLRNDTKLEEEMMLSRQVIERFMIKPLKNYHLAYQNHPIAHQQSLLQAQLQQQFPKPADPALHQHTASQSHPADAPSMFQNQQYLQRLMEQQKHYTMAPEAYQNQQAIQQQQQQLAQMQAHAAVPRTAERSTSVTGAPPPPGLFVANPGMHQQSQPMPQYVDPAVSATGHASGPSSSSQLLTQLMSGKK